MATGGETRSAAQRVCPRGDREAPDAVPSQDRRSPSPRGGAVHECDTPPLAQGGAFRRSGGAARSRRPFSPGPAVDGLGLAGGNREALVVRTHPAAGPAGANLGQPEGTPQPRDRLVVLEPGDRVALHAAGWVMAQLGRIGPADPGPAGVGGSGSENTGGGNPAVGGDGSRLEPGSHAVRVGRETTRPEATGEGAASCLTRVGRLYPQAYPPATTTYSV